MNIKNNVIADDGTWWTTDRNSMDVLVPEQGIKIPYVLVPDGAGDYKNHLVPTIKRKIGFTS